MNPALVSATTQPGHASGQRGTRTTTLRT
jgi:hypothetical protein